MAQKTVVELIDDIDGSEAHNTIRFALDGQDYAIDLSEDNEAALREALEPYLEAATRLPSKPVGRTATARRTRSHDYDPTDVREWARGRGMTVGERGRIPAKVLAAYQQAQAS